MFVINLCRMSLLKCLCTFFLLDIDFWKSFGSKVISRASCYLYILVIFLSLTALNCFLFFYLLSLVRRFRLLLASLQSLLVLIRLSPLFHFFALVCFCMSPVCSRLLLTCGFVCFYRFYINPFYITGLRENIKNLWFSDVFRGNRERPVVWNVEMWRSLKAKWPIRHSLEMHIIISCTLASFLKESLIVL